jgi:uncharacterized protein YggL (DUF469 family)
MKTRTCIIDDTTDDYIATQDEFAELVRDLAHEFAKAVNAEWESEQSDEYVDDCICANEYEFLADGSRA